MATTEFDEIGKKDPTLRDLAGYKIDKLYLNIWDIIQGSRMKLDKPSLSNFYENAFKTVQADTKERSEEVINEEGNTVTRTVVPRIQSNNSEFYKGMIATIATQQYNKAMREYHKQTKDQGKVITILRLYMSDPIRTKLVTFNDAAEAFNYLVKQYKLSDRQNGQQLLQEIEHLYLKNCKNLDDFFSRFEDRVDHLREIGFQYDENLI
ncbi:hypothetical protein BDV24DRAFT_170494 [Aspergillus arachidicola]|uniref:Uncharacterized protein n=1 Tax=Aspergillus arachidicola TaxID=656916 RepID=A0A5N6XLJ8_9EURO|nr:hypothetical protein BDV24DRAFT_170494 [Aspergillus arachidicola]